MTIIHFFNKQKSNKQFTINQPHYSEDDEYSNQNQQNYSINLPNNKQNNIDKPDNIYQPEIFEQYMHSEQTRQTSQPFPQRQRT